MSIRKPKTLTTAQLLAKKETRVGLTVLGVIFVSLGMLGLSEFRKAASRLGGSSQTASATQLLSPVPSTNGLTITPSPAATNQAAVEDVNQKLQAVKTLSYTSSSYSVRVREGDNFWSIAKRVCGNGKLATQIQRQTGYTHRVLQPGTMLSVSCE